jgi:hypothetical protein
MMTKLHCQAIRDTRFSQWRLQADIMQPHRKVPTQKCKERIVSSKTDAHIPLLFIKTIKCQVMERLMNNKWERACNFLGGNVEGNKSSQARILNLRFPIAKSDVNDYN